MLLSFIGCRTKRCTRTCTSPRALYPIVRPLFRTIYLVYGYLPPLIYATYPPFPSSLARSCFRFISHLLFALVLNATPLHSPAAIVFFVALTMFYLVAHILQPSFTFERGCCISIQHAASFHTCHAIRFNVLVIVQRADMLRTAILKPGAAVLGTYAPLLS